MKTDTPAKVDHVILEVEMRVPVAIPQQLIDDLYDGKPVDEMRQHELVPLLQESDALEDAIDEYLESMPDFDNIEYVEDEEREPEPKIELRKPGEGEHWTLPVPSFRSGLVRFGPRGIEEVAESGVNSLTDEQVQGAHWALETAWGVRGMNRRQKQSLAELLSETQWAMMARPTLHDCKLADTDESGQVAPDECVHCHQLESAHAKAAADSVDTIGAAPDSESE